MGTNLTANVLGCSLLLLLSSGCAFFKNPFEDIKQIEVTAEPIQRAPLVLPEIDTVVMKDVEWVIITQDNWEEVLAETEEAGKPLAFFALTDDGYANISINYQNARQIIQQQQAIIAAYEAYYVEYDQNDEETTE